MEESKTDLTQCIVCDWHIENEKLRERIKGFEQENRLLRIVIAEALEECIGDDIEKATAILEKLP